MDASQLTAFVVLVITIALSRLIFSGTLGAGDVMASLFVPPDRALGWPHGVQESDEPWGWRKPSPPVAAVPSMPDDGAGGTSGPTTGDRIEPREGTYVVPVERVRPVRLVVRPR